MYLPARAADDTARNLKVDVRTSRRWRSAAGAANASAAYFSRRTSVGITGDRRCRHLNTSSVPGLRPSAEFYVHDTGPCDFTLITSEINGPRLFVVHVKTRLRFTPFAVIASKRTVERLTVRTFWIRRRRGKTQTCGRVKFEDHCIMRNKG